MSRLLLGSLLIGSLACAPAYADRGALPGPLTAGHAVESPYDVEILDADGLPLDTYLHRGRYYVRGDRGDRYVVRVSNPTARRVEAVITVDGLDVIDGEPGDLRKRGYVIQPYGELRVEGFRTSTTDVATFRFSSVGASYAGRKGKARNVGVVAVALFDEVPPEPVYIPAPPPPPVYYRGDADYGAGATSDAAPGRPQASAKAESAPAPAAPSQGRAATMAPAQDESACCAAPRRERPGLGTEYGEQRYSAVSFTRFVRASRRPSALVELRYNDAAGLMALGIPVEPLPDHDEVFTRETANPFPGDHRFARPPAGVH